MNNGEKKKKLFMSLIKELHSGKSPQEVKETFKRLLTDVGPEEIAQIEEKLIEEGLPREEIRKLCDVHLAVFKESLEKQEVDVEDGHPLHTFMEEHKIFLQDTEELKEIVQILKSAGTPKSIREDLVRLNDIAQHLAEKESHNVREENVLFPYLEKHGITEPPAIMWTEHNEMRKKMKGLMEIIRSPHDTTWEQFVSRLETIVDEISDLLSSHIYKENNILYPAALSAVSREEWPMIRSECDELGYSVFTPVYMIPGTEISHKEPDFTTQGQIPIEPGTLSLDELEAILNTLPVDISFVDDKDHVRYFNQPRERIFPRTKAVIGRSVQKCHPQKSVHLVNQILDDFRNERREVAEFWIQMGERLVHIRYYSLRDKNGKYLGCLEVTQDITEIKKIEGEKRLL